MATLENLQAFTGPIGNLTAYKRKDSDQVFLRSKSGVSKKRIQKDPAYAKTRSLNAEWSGCSKAALLVRNLLVQQQPVFDFNISAALTAIAKNIQSKDTTQEIGKRAIRFSQYGYLLEGFQLNRKNTVEAIVRGQIIAQIDVKKNSALIQLPELIHGISFLPPVHLPLFQINLSFGTLPDMQYLKNQYGFPINDPMQQTMVHHQTKWYYTLDTIEAQTIRLQLPTSTHPTNNQCLLMAIGIHFGTPITDQLVKTNKYVGAGKILKVEGGGE